MKLCILHFSDIHFHAEGNKLSKHLQQLADSAVGEAETADKVLVAMTGDIAYSGLAEEYKHAVVMVSAIVNALLKADPARQVYVAAVPGNHDCDFSSPRALRDLIVDNPKQIAAYDPSVVGEALSVQKNYRKFCAEISSLTADANGDQLICSATITLGTESVAIVGVNTAWVSQRHEVPARLRFPTHVLTDVFESLSPGVNVVLLHHPLGWLEPENRRALVRVLDKHADYVLAGHEHEVESWRRNTADEPETTYLEGGVLQDHHQDTFFSSYSVLNIDLANRVSTIAIVEFDGSFYRRGAQEERPFERASKLVKPSRVLRSRVQEEILGVGANFKHPRKREMTLEDIYVSPDVVSLKQSESLENLDRPTPADTVLKDLARKGGLVVVSGGEKSGKTAYLRRAFSMIHAAGHSPVLIEGSKIRNADEDKLVQIVEQVYVDSYDVKGADEWRQLEKESRCVLIDDLGTSHLNSAAVAEVLAVFAKHYGLVLATCDEAQFFRTTVADQVFPGYSIYKMLEFGHLRRDQLVTKWVKLGQDETIEATDFELQREQKLRAINALIGKNFIPARPILLLTLLQSMEVGAEASIQGSSYGQYYEYLIRHSLSSGGVKPADLDAVLNYLTELAYFFVESERPELDEHELQRFDHEFSSRYALTVDLNRLRGQLVKCSILSDWSGQTSFRYKYVKLFFAARYLAKRFTTEETARESVRALVRHLYLSKCAELMMFVVHHCDDAQVVDLILAEARSVFSQEQPCQMLADVEFINELVAEVPSLMLRDGSTAEHRERKMKDRDASAAIAEEEEVSEYSLSDLRGRSVVPVLDFAAEANHSLRVVGILGQIIRNYYGSLIAERKEEIADTAYDLLARTLSAFIRLFESERDQIVAGLAEWLEEQGVVSQTEAKERASRLLFSLVSGVGFGVIKRGSELLGSEKVRLTHAAVSDGATSAFRRLLWLATDLDHPASPEGYSKLPVDRLRRVQQDLSRNPHATYVLRRLVLDHLYMFTVSYKDKQRLCELMGFSVKQQRQIESRSARKKL